MYTLLSCKLEKDCRSFRFPDSQVYEDDTYYYYVFDNLLQTNITPRPFKQAQRLGIDMLVILSFHMFLKLIPQFKNVIRAREMCFFFSIRERANRCCSQTAISTQIPWHYGAKSYARGSHYKKTYTSALAHTKKQRHLALDLSDIR